MEKGQHRRRPDNSKFHKWGSRSARKERHWFNYSVKQDGGRIYARKTTNGLIALTVFYDDTAITEDYVFQLDGRGTEW
jgi:hypothetical protein